MYTADRKLIAEFGERRLIPVTLDQVPDLFVSAVLDTEDKRFYEHHGVDLISLGNAVRELVMNRGEITRGGSTITMQLPRNLGTFSLDQLFIRKFKEILLALKIERALTKDEILELYINAVPFGKRAYGAQAAAMTYYGRPLADLDLAQLAMLAGIPQAPTAGNPLNNAPRAVARRNQVLARMFDQGSIDREQYEKAVAAPDTARLHDRNIDVNSPYPAEWVRRQLLPRFPDLYSGGYEVITTLDSELQHQARTALRAGLTAYDRRHGYRGPEAQLGQQERDVYLEALAGTRRYMDQEPAVVTELGDQHALAMLDSGAEVRVEMAGMTWARPYLNENARGPAPRQPADVLAVGDLIRLRPERAPVEEAAATDEAPEAAPPREPAIAWKLTQIPEIQGALVALDSRNGAVRSLVGGYDFGINQFDHALQAARQPGSGFKPFVYSAALAAGFTPASVLMDAPLVFRDRNLESEYRPDNDDLRYRGPTRLREALYRSVNLVSIRVLLEVGAPAVIEHAARFGFDTGSFPRNTQLAIGGGTMAVTPIQMARGYAVFANGGHLIDPYIVDEVRDVSGQVLFKTRPTVVCEGCALPDAAPEESAVEVGPIDLAALGNAGSRASGTLAEALQADSGNGVPADGLEDDPPPLPAPEVLDPRIAYLMNSMLGDVIRRGTGTRARALERGDLGGKTGTTDDAADTWFTGFNPDLVTSVWVGMPDHTPLGRNEYGSNNPLPIWVDYMGVALAGRPEHTPVQPSGMVTMRIDPATGHLAAPGDPDSIFEYFLEEHAPRTQSRNGTPDRQDPDELKPVEIF